MLTPASSLEFDLRSGETAINRYWDLRQHLQLSSESEIVLLDRLSETFRTAVERRLSPSGINWLSLSAGMDSRAIAAVMNTTDAPVKAVTSGVAGGYESKVTSDISSTIGVEHLFYTFDESQLTQSESEFTDLMREAFNLTDGMRGTASSAMTAFTARQSRKNGLEMLITGHGGEIAKLDEAYNFSIRTLADVRKLESEPADWVFDRLLGPNAPRFNTPALYKGKLAQAFAHAPRQHIQAIMDQLDANLQPEQIVSFLFLNELYRKRASYALSVQRAYGEIHVPFYDDDFLATVVNAPLRLRSNYKIHRHIIKQNCPALLDIILSETRMRPFPSTAERLFRGLPYSIAKRLGLFKRDVPEHYFAANANTAFFRKTLLDSTTLDRGYFNSDQISKLLDAQAQGQGTANTLLHLLTIVELWHRDFIDKDILQSAQSR
jgi:asparagine synthetase B (glutamine-hydrolysing)